MMKVPNNIAMEEELGRDVFSKRKAKRAQRSGARLNVFLEKLGETDISVDRLSVAPPDEAIAIADNVALERNKIFYGWAVVTTEEVSSNQRQVIASPLPTNPYHADIVLPSVAAEDREEQKRHAQELADASRWRDRPNSREE